MGRRPPMLSQRGAAIAALAVATAGCGRFGFGRSDLGTDGPAIDGAVDAAPVIDASPPDARVSGPCTGTELFDDEFSDSAPEPIFYLSAEQGVTAVEAGGEVSFDIASTVGPLNYTAYRTNASYPSAGLCAVVEITGMPVNGGAAYFKMVAGPLQIELYVVGDVMYPRTQVDDVIDFGAAVPFDLATMRFWRLRQDGTTTRWETSADGVVYVERLFRDGFFTGSGTLELGAGAETPTLDGGAARYTRAFAFAQ